MKPMEAAGNFLVGQVIFPATNFLLGRKGVLAKHSELLRYEHLPEEALRRIQHAKLVELLEFANLRVPYYRRLFRKLDFYPADIKNLEDLRHLPVLSREEVKAHYAEMIDERLRESIDRRQGTFSHPGAPVFLSPLRKHKLVYNTTSGSTGTPTIFFQDAMRSAINWAHELRVKSWFGLSPGIREARFMRESAEFNPHSLKHRLRQTLWHQMVFPSSNLHDGVLAQSLDRLRTFKPVILFGNTSALTSVARFIQENEIDLADYRPRLVVTWSAPLLQHEEHILTTAFQCPVTNIYGTREVGHVAMRCPAGGYHLNQESALVEIKPLAGEVSEEGAGEIFVTPLDPSPMPFIRYRVGDVGRKTSAKCSCGRSLPLISEVLGRSGELYQLENGRKLSPNFWSHIFRDDELVFTVSRFQVIYQTEGRIRILVVPNDGYTPHNETRLRQRLRDLLGPEIRVAVEQVPVIPPLPSGKYQVVVNQAGGC